MSINYNYGQKLISEITALKAQDTPKTQSVKAAIATHSGKVYEMLNFGEVDTEEFHLALMAITNDFRTFTHDSHSELNPMEKMKLKHAFIDLTDDIREAVLARMESDLGAKKGQSWSSWLWEGAVATAGYGLAQVYGSSSKKEIEPNEFLDSLTGFQDAMSNPDLPVSLANVKKVIADTLEKIGERGFGDASADFDTQELISFLKQLPEYESRHLEREAIFQARLGKAQDEMKSTISAAADRISKAARDYAMQKKDALVKSYALGFTPQALFGDVTFKAVVEKLVADLLKSQNLDYSIIRKAAQGCAEEYRKIFAENITVFSDERNMACLAERMTGELTAVAKSLRTLEKDATPEDLIQALGYGEISYQEFMEKMDADISKYLARLLTKNAEFSENAETTHISKGLWAKIKAGFRKFISLFQKRVANKALRRTSPPTWIVEHIPKELQSGSEWALRLGLQKDFQNLTSCSEIITLHLFKELTREMGIIARDSRASQVKGGDGNASGYSSSKEATEAFKEAVKILTDELRLFKPEGEGGLLQKGLFALMGLFGDIAIIQGTGNSIFDVATPAFEVLQPAWFSWLT